MELDIDRLHNVFFGGGRASGRYYRHKGRTTLWASYLVSLSLLPDYEDKTIGIAVKYQQNIDHSVATGLKDDYGEKHTNSKLTNQEAAYIRSQYRDGVKQVDLARMFGVSKQAVNNIVHNKSYIR